MQPSSQQTEFGFARDLAPEAAPAPINQRLRDLTRPDMVQVAPGRWAPAPGRKPPDFTIAEWHQNPDGTFTPVPHPERMVRLTRKLVARLVGESIQMHTFYRLARAGFIEIVHPVPGMRLINIDSWYNHLRRCSETPEMWGPESKFLRAYRMAQGWIDRDTRREASGRRRVKASRRL